MFNNVNKYLVIQQIFKNDKNIQYNSNNKKF